MPAFREFDFADDLTMAIEFPCPTCKTLIRTPDGSAGKPARCPQCKSVVVVPEMEGTETSPATAAGKPQLEPAHAAQAAAPNPFADKPRQPINPYAAPASATTGDPLHSLSAAELDERARARLTIPAILMMVTAIIGLAVMCLVGLAVTLNPDDLMRDVGDDPARRAGAIGFFIGYFGLGFLSRALQILGALAMLRRRGYGMALTGAICAMLPCEVYCCLPNLPFGIWALIMLNSAETKAAFRL